MDKFGNFLWGLVFIVIGAIIGLNALEITNINIFFDGWWTLIIIIPCFIGLFKTNSGKLGNFIGLAIGIFLLLVAQDIVELEIVLKLLVPFILIAIGVSIIGNGIITNKVSKKIKETNKNNLESYAATFSEQNIVKQNEEFNGANLDAVFGGVKLDLQKATINQDIVINASAIFGGITILVPSNINVKVKSTPIFGGVSNKVLNNNAENVKTIYINAFSMFGGVDIK